MVVRSVWSVRTIGSAEREREREREMRRSTLAAQSTKGLICLQGFFSSLLLSSQELSDTQVMSHEYEPSSEPLHISAKYWLLN